jgi:formylglycine-generating enzyme required for sulfatase activity
MDLDPDGLRRAHEFGEVARTAAGDDPAVRALLSRIDGADKSVKLDQLGEREFAAGRMGGEKEGEGALAYFREAQRNRPGDARAAQGIAAIESTMIRRAEDAAAKADFPESDRWLALAAKVRPGSSTVPDARQRIAMVRTLRVNGLRDDGMAALMREGGLPKARRILSDMLLIAAPGDPAAAELRERIDQVAHYGLFRAGQAFTDALHSGARGPQMVVVPHGGFLMGAREGEADSLPAEKPAHYVRFDRGFAMQRTETTVGEFRRFIEATHYRTRAERRQYSTVYDERSGNLVRRSNVDWRHTYTGALATRRPAGPPRQRARRRGLRALARAADRREIFAAERSAIRIRGARAARSARCRGVAHPAALRGQRDRRARPFTHRAPWRNAFPGYGDGWWGPAPAGSFAPNAFGLHDLAGNVSEWVADCWHQGYRRAPVGRPALGQPGLPPTRDPRRLMVERTGAGAFGLAPVDGWRHHQCTARVPSGSRAVNRERSTKERRQCPIRMATRCSSGVASASVASAGGCCCCSPATRSTTGPRTAAPIRSPAKR